MKRESIRARDRDAGPAGAASGPSVRICMLLGALACIAFAQARAADTYREEMKGLDEQVQEVKSDVLDIDTQLTQLEEKLLYPSDTQVAVFVRLVKGDALGVDAVEIRIDGKLAADYIYSYRELEALRKGGVQRIYTGNIATGQHEIDVSVSGKLASGKDYSRSQPFPFTKTVRPELIGVTLAGPDSSQPGIRIGNW